MLLSWFIYELCLDKNKNVKDKLYAEIDNYGKNGKEPTYNDFVSGFNYLEGALCEALRLWPSVPIVGRDCVKDIILPIKDANGNNFVIRKGDHCFADCYVNGRSTKIWGDDALEFKPDRWKQKGLNTFDQYNFPQFNINPRLCLGKQFAMMQTKVVAYNLLKNFTFDRIKEKEVLIKSGAILNMDTGLFIKLNERN